MSIQFIKSQLQRQYAFAQTISLPKVLASLKRVFQLLPFARHRYKKRLAIANYYLLIVVMATTFFCSCQKEQVSDPSDLNSTSSSTASVDARRRHRSSTNVITNYGAFICPPDPGPSGLAFQKNVAGKLGVSCLRGYTPVPGTGNSPQILSSGYRVLLNFVAENNSGSDPAPFVTNLTKYKADLNKIIDVCTVKPVVAVIENEESNRYFYSGTAQQYINQLNAAIEVMHARGIKVANGGITSQGLNYLVYQDFMDQGKEDSAKQFQLLVGGIAVKDAATQDRGAFIDILLTNYTKMDLDYVNFHWKGTSPDTEGLREVINYLKKRSNKPIISNEFGQFDTDPNTLLAMSQLSDNQNLPYSIWYSPDENAGKRDTPLQHNDATLTRTGVAYQDFLAQ
ncbi:hypothetical protein FC093_05205 [Ilyomonas limi]|uniref:Asl1-like glycosyl hydrolase catalytic domain-containing protein n=1 Tax=Ilyomonas limi TaxID=2575867 RepID=A0A4V6XAX2_9BACT|nr:hypothetical protein [Ilyomonas limi]TKK70153.1 hypothetical protein FC093_05205 [Ilyomonas limi]